MMKGKWTRNCLQTTSSMMMNIKGIISSNKAKMAGIKQKNDNSSFLTKCSRSPGVHTQQEKRNHPQNLSSETISKVEDIMEEEEINNIDSGNECLGDHDIKEEYNGKDENIEAESNFSKSSNRYDGKVSKTEQLCCH